MSRYNYLKPDRWWIIETHPSMGHEPDGMIAGPFDSFDEAEAFRKKHFGPDNINYYTKKANE